MAKKEVITKGTAAIVRERYEQIHKHGRTIANDVMWNAEGQMRRAIELLVRDEVLSDHVIHVLCPFGWDAKIWEKMCRKPYIERLAIVGAFCAAEIDRLEKIKADFAQIGVKV